VRVLSGAEGEHVHQVSKLGVLVHITCGNPPPGSTILQTDPNRKWGICKDSAGKKRIQFDASEARRMSKGPLGPGRGTPLTGAAIDPNGKVVVVEGMHRLDAAKAGVQIPVGQGGVPNLPGWLEFDLWP
jgi:hypothetical protein